VASFVLVVAQREPFLLGVPLVLAKQVLPVIGQAQVLVVLVLGVQVVFVAQEQVPLLARAPLQRVLQVRVLVQASAA
jgi:hypothetical protein